METPGNLFCVAAPSGTGKSSLVKALLELDSHLVQARACDLVPPALAVELTRRVTHTARLLVALIRALQRPRRPPGR